MSEPEETTTIRQVWWDEKGVHGVWLAESGDDVVLLTGDGTVIENLSLIAEGRHADSGFSGGMTLSRDSLSAVAKALADAATPGEGK